MNRYNFNDATIVNVEHKQNDNNAAIQIHGLPPPPLSPPKNGRLNGYHHRARSNSLPYYELPKSIKTGKSHSKLNNNTKQLRIQLNPHTVSENIHNHKQRAHTVQIGDNSDLKEQFYENRRNVLHGLARGKNKKDVMNKLDVSIEKIENKLKVYSGNLMSLKEELSKINDSMNKELKQWENINNFNLTNLCRSYYSNFALLIQIRIEIATKYCECFRDKYRQLKKTRDRIKKDVKKYSLDDLVLTVEAAMMSASNIRLPQEIKTQRDNEKSLSMVIKELKKKYLEKKYEDIIQPMSAQDRSKHILTMLVQLIDTSNKNKTTMTRNVSDGLPYFHPQDNGYQTPFEQLLYDPRFKQKKIIYDFISKYIINDHEINIKIIDKENLSLTKISTFVYKLTNSFLDSCELNTNSPFFQTLFWDCTNLMIGRSIFPKFHDVIKYIINKDTKSVALDNKYKKQLVWMSDLDQKRIGIESQFQYYYIKKRKSLQPKASLIKPSKKKNNEMRRKSSMFVDKETEKEEKVAYYKPILRLKQLPNIIVPQDSIVLVIDTIHDIQKLAIKYSKNKMNKKNKQNQVIISGDSLFPIIVYCLIQSNVQYWNRWIFMMKNFYTQKILSFGQSGFCFALINAAVTYILQQKPSNFGLYE